MELNFSFKTGNFSLRNIFKRATSTAKIITDPTAFLMGGGLSGGVGYSGRAATEETALKYMAYYKAVNMISDAFATLNWNVHFENDQGTQRDRQNQIYQLLRTRPSKLHNSTTWRKLMMLWVLMHGDAIARIVTNAAGTVTELIPIHPKKYWSVTIQDGEKYYHFRHLNDPLHQDEVLHFMGMSLDGLVGITPIQKHAETIGIGLAHQEQQGKYYKNGYFSPFYLSAPGALKEGRPAEIGDDFKEKYAGMETGGRPPVLHSGLELKNMGINQRDAQALEHGNFNIEDVARAFNLPLHKLALLDKPSYNSLEQQNIEYVQDCLMPWARTIENEVEIKLLQPGRWLKVSLNDLLRGDIKTRYEAYRIALSHRMMNPDEVRALEEMPKSADGKGGEYLTPVNMQTSEELELKIQKLEEENEQLKNERTGKNGHAHKDLGYVRN